MSVRTISRWGLGALVLSTMGSVWWAPPGHAALGGEERVDVSSAEVPSDGFLQAADDMSSDGRFIVFTSDATTLVAGDSNGLPDVFLRDRVAGTTRLVSTAGAPANGASDGASVSDDGRYVAFTSSATNLAGGTGGVFVRDLTSGTVTRVGSGGSAALSANGRYVAFHTGVQTRRWDRTTATSVAVNPGGSPQISGSGRYVVTFGFDADDQPSYRFTDLSAGTTRDLWQRAENSPDYSWDDEPSAPVLSTNGRYVAFSTDGTGFNPADTTESEEVYVVDTGDGDRYLRVAAELQEVSFGPLAISGNGRVMVLQLFDNAVFEYGQTVTLDRVSGLVSRVSWSFGGSAALDFTGHRVAASDDSGVLTGTVAQCTIGGTSGDDTLTGTSGPDVICGRGGDDLIQGRGGNDVLAGGPGTDTLSFTRSNSDVAVRMYAWYARGAGMDEIYGLENVDGSAYDDVLIGDQRGNRLRGLDGDDRLEGYGGADTLAGGPGGDTCHGGDGTDVATACESVTAVP